MDAIITTDFDALNVKIHQYCIDNVPDYLGVQWAKPLVHTDGRIAIKIKDYVLPALTTQEQADVVTLPGDWFPVEL